MNAICSTNSFNPSATASDEAMVTPLRAPTIAANSTTGSSGFSKALTIFKGAVIASSVTFVVIVLALQAAARFA